MTLALDVLARGTASPHYAWVRDMLKYVVAGGNEPACIGGYPTQHEMYVTSVAALLRNHAIWDTLTAAEKAKWDTVMTATLVTNAFVTSDKNPYIQANTTQRDLRGGTNLNRDWNPNYSMGMVPSVLVAMAYFGGVAQATSILDGFNVATFAATANGQGLMNIARTYARTWGANSPTATQIQNAIRGWRWWECQLQDIETLVQEHVDWMWSATVQRGLNGGAGIGGCGTTILNLTPPNNGQKGMGLELDAWDANGRRSDLRHVLGGHRCVVQTLIVLAARGYWNPKSSVAQAVFERMDIGVTDVAWRLFTAGYKDYAYGGCQIEWRPNDPAKIAEWGLTYTVGLWTEVFRPYHEAARGNPGNPSENNPPPNDPPASGSGEIVSIIEQYGIVGNLAAPREVGHYVSGDPWIAYESGQNVTFNSFNPPSQQVNGTWRHGLVLDYGGTRLDEGGGADFPNSAQRNEGGWDTLANGSGAWEQGFDGRAPGPTNQRLWYADIRNLDPGRRGPLVIGTSNKALEATIHKARSLDVEAGNEPKRVLDTMIYWTVIPSSKRPPKDGFRPSSAFPDKTSPYSLSDLDLSKWPNLGPRPSGSPDPDAVYEEIRRPLQVGSRYDDRQRSINPEKNQANFGRDLAEQHATAALLCCYNITQEQKRKLSIALCQRGIDVDGILRLGGGSNNARGRWMERGAILAGRKMPLYVLALLTGDPALVTRLQGTQNNFHEDRNLFYVTQQIINGSYGQGNYVQADLGMPEYSIHPITDGRINGSDLYSSYRPQNSRYLLGNALVVLATNGKAVWGHNVMLDYADRMQNACNQLAADSNNVTNAPPAWHRTAFAALRNEFLGVHPRRWGPAFFAHR
jgi:hypothetical protein